MAISPSSSPGLVSLPRTAAAAASSSSPSFLPAPQWGFPSPFTERHSYKPLFGRGKLQHSAPVVTQQPSSSDEWGKVLFFFSHILCSFKSLPSLVSRAVHTYQTGVFFFHCVFEVNTGYWILCKRDILFRSSSLLAL
jgi:hypothetical protein